MSYSFNVRGETKDAAKVAVAEAFDKVVQQQKIHARDRDAVIANANAVIDLLGGNVPEGHLIAVSCNGYVSWHNEALKEDGSNVDVMEFTTASISAVASYFMPSAG